MKDPTFAIRVRLGARMLAHVENVRRNVEDKLRRKVPRAALLRATIALAADELTLLDVQALDKLLLSDPMRRGPVAGMAQNPEGAPMSTNGHDKPAGKAKTSRIKRAPRPKLAALFLLGTDGETYAACPWPSGFPPLGDDTDALLCVRLKRPERDLVLDAVHTDGVIEAAKLLVRIARPDA